MGSFLASAVLNAIWQIPIVTAAGWLTTRVLRRIGPAAEHRVWVGALILSVLLPLVPVRQPGIPTSTHYGLAVHGIGTSQAASEQNPSHWLGPVHLPAPAMDSLCVLWSLTALFGALRLFVGLVRTRSLLTTATPCDPDDDLQRIWQECRHLMGVGATDLFLSRHVSGPVTLAVDMDAVVLPLGFQQEVGREELRAALLHECAHVRRKDFRNNLLYQLLALPVQFHPAIRYVKQQLASSREMACDEAVVDATGDGLAYGDRLLRLATWMCSPVQVSPNHAVGMFDTNILEERIMRIHAGKPVVARATHFALLGVSACVITVGVASAMASRVEVVPPAPAQARGAEAIYLVGKDATAPELVFQVEPEYTPAARAAKTSGECIVAAIVSAQGVPQNVHVTKSLRSDLDANAIATVKQYRFHPGLHNGKPVRVQISVAVNYQIF